MLGHDQFLREITHPRVGLLERQIRLILLVVPIEPVLFSLSIAIENDADIDTIDPWSSRSRAEGTHRSSNEDIRNHSPVAFPQSLLSFQLKAKRVQLCISNTLLKHCTYPDRS